MSFSILVVCTGNIQRSASAQFLLRARLADGAASADAAAITVSSAGTGAVVGWPIDAPAALALRELGVDSSGHIAQQLTPRLLRVADLVLTAQYSHANVVTQLAPRAIPRTFTLREFAHAAAARPAPRAGNEAELRARVTQVNEQRRSHPALPRAEADIGDPYGARIEVIRATVGLISRTVDEVIAGLGLDRAEFDRGSAAG